MRLVSQGGTATTTYLQAGGRGRRAGEEQSGGVEQVWGWAMGVEVQTPSPFPVKVASTARPARSLGAVDARVGVDIHRGVGLGDVAGGGAGLDAAPQLGDVLQVAGGEGRPARDPFSTGKPPHHGAL